VALDVDQLAQEITAAYRDRRELATPSSRDASFDIPAAYAVETELVRERRAAGHVPVGRKVGYANKAAWRLFKLETVVWAHMYDDTVRYARGGETSLSIGRMFAPKIEPEIVFKLKSTAPLPNSEGAAPDAADVLAACEWIALGFEVIDCPYPGWQLQPADFVAAFGLHAALIVGDPRPIDPGMIDDLPRFKVRLSKNGELVEEGSGRNALRSPALSLAEVISAAARPPVADPVQPGEIISTGTLTESKRIAPGETWSAEVDGLAVSKLTVRVEN
jgi:2-oxo-3-hexenedioate decarboxylase